MFTEGSNISVSKAPEVAVRKEQSPQIRTPQKEKVETPTPEINSNAVSISISSAKISSNSDDPIKISTPKAAEIDLDISKKGSDVIEDKAEKLAQRLEEALNKVAGTKVSFGVQTVTKENSGDINFRVVDKDTGETVREFPPESLYSFEKALANDSSTGILVDVES